SRDRIVEIKDPWLSAIFVEALVGYGLTEMETNYSTIPANLKSLVKVAGVGLR
ncbi:hypothetical protein U1Q18_029880, partial [Sarracenia purpurea var. burkii]